MIIGIIIGILSYEIINLSIEGEKIYNKNPRYWIELSRITEAWKGYRLYIDNYDWAIDYKDWIINSEDTTVDRRITKTVEKITKEEYRIRTNEKYYTRLEELVKKRGIYTGKKSIGRIDHYKWPQGNIGQTIFKLINKGDWSREWYTWKKQWLDYRNGWINRKIINKMIPCKKKWKWIDPIFGRKWYITTIHLYPEMKKRIYMRKIIKYFQTNYMNKRNRIELISNYIQEKKDYKEMN